MISFGDDPVRPEVTAAFERSWAECAEPGTWWTGEERVAIADAARQAFVGDRPLDGGLPAAANEAVRKLAVEPGATSAAWARGVIEALGELRYVELAGVVGRVVAMDAFCRLTGRGPVELPDARPGEPSGEPPPPGVRRDHIWVPMVKLSAPHVLGAVPAAAVAMNDLANTLYMTEEQIADPDLRRGDLHRTQMELAAATVSHGNECFY